MLLFCETMKKHNDRTTVSGVYTGQCNTSSASIASENVTTMPRARMFTATADKSASRNKIIGSQANQDPEFLLKSTCPTSCTVVNATESIALDDHKHNSLSIDTWSRDESIVAQCAEKSSNEIRIPKRTSQSSESRTVFEGLLSTRILRAQNDSPTNSTLHGIPHNFSTVNSKFAPENLVTEGNDNLKCSISCVSSENSHKNCVSQSTACLKTEENEKSSLSLDRVNYYPSTTVQCKARSRTLNKIESEKCGKKVLDCYSCARNKLSDYSVESKVTQSCRPTSVHLEQKQNSDIENDSPHSQIFVNKKFPSTECVSLENKKLSEKRVVQGRSLTSLVHCQKHCCDNQHNHQLHDCASLAQNQVYSQPNVPLSLFNLNYRQPVILRNNTKHTNRLYHQSAINLFEGQKAEHQRIGSSGSPALLARSEVQNDKEKCLSTETGNRIGKATATADRKRLCKSLSNITADDLLNIPCASIHDKTYKYRRSHKTPNPEYIGFSKPVLIPSAPKSPAEPSNVMPKPKKQSIDNRNSDNNFSLSIAQQQDELGLAEAIGGEKERKNGTDNVKTQITSSGNREFNEKPTRKVPKLPKSLFPFKRKSVKRHNNTSASQAIPLKTKEGESGKSPNNFKQNRGEIDCSYKEMKNNIVSTVPDSKDEEKSPTVMETLGFKKLKVPSKKTQRNVHDDYATRVARVRTLSTGEKESSPTSLPSSEEIHNQARNSSSNKTEGVIFRHKPRPRRNGSRHSADLSLTSENASIRPRRRPMSLAAPSRDPTWRYSRYFQPVDDGDNVIIVPPEAKDDSESNTKHGAIDTEPRVQTTRSKTNSFANTNVVALQNSNSSFNDQLHVPDRSSLNLEGTSTSTFRHNSLPNTVTGLSLGKNGNTSHTLSVSESSTQMSNFLTVAGPKLIASCDSVFGDVISRDKTKSKVQWSSETKETDETVTQQRNKTTNNAVVRRSRSLGRDKTPSRLNTIEMNRRSVSPSFYGHKPPYIGQRNQSLKDLSSSRRPSKPTTPKPRKLTTSSSTSSLTKVNFHLSSQNSAPVLNQQTSSRQGSNQEIPGDANNGEVRIRSSAKNIQIRRRLSLQACLSIPSEPVELSSQFLKEFEERKRHSIADVNSEKFKTATTPWAIASSSGATSNSRRVKRKIRPHSEVQNLRWDVQAIPEHNEVSSSSPADGERLFADKFGSEAASGGSSSKDSQSQKVAVQLSQTPRLLHCDESEVFQLGVVGTCFSEEELSTIPEEEFTCNPRLPRSLSVIGGINVLPESLLRFYPIKYYGEKSRFYSFPSGHVTYPLSPFGHELYEKSRGQGSTVSGLSNESGYGTMTRRKAHLKPNDTDDEEVFTQSHSSRLSNGDFPNEDGLFVEALWDHVTMDHDELGFKVGDVIRVIDMSNADWWWGELDSNEGWFPATFVRILVNQHREDPENSDVISTRNDDDTLSISSHEYSRVTDFGEDLCQCTERVSTSSVHCSQCGRPLRGVDPSPANRDANELVREQPQIVVSPPANVKKSGVNRDHIRKNVINEIVNSEKVFAGHLKDVIEGYLTRSRQRTDWFTNEQIATLFGNIEEIYQFQKKFAAELEAAVNKTSIHETELGNIFLDHKFGFTIYSEYCNNHPQALALLSQLLMTKKYIHFFEACRLLQRMIDIPLDGFLLTPVQKICKYPLQLAELLKYTAPEHPDYKPVQSALETMKGVAKMINERKRKMENIKKISLWQSSIVNWQGENVLELSNELVHSGEAYALSQSKNKPKPRMVFLFDHQMIICKKDVLRKDLLYYKSRINLDNCDIFPIEGYSPRSSMNLSGDWSSTGSGSTQCGWKIVDKASGDSSVMICKCEDDFDKWMRAFPHEREIALSHRDDDTKNELIQDLLKTSLASPRKPKDSSTFRAPPYRFRSKLGQESHLPSKYKVVHSPLEKNNVGFFSSVAGKLAPSFRRATVREGNVVY